ncbi:MAG: hypothetical protein LBG58_00905 [Planctomycetaceae bacterium]|jgi:hypothetical protein|nr:hypothetical protein [Planctomycetaceae bacterium]
MWRLLRRQLRIWHKDFASGWGRLNTFHRTVLGILIAIAIVYAARKYCFDSISATIAEAQSNYDKSEPPNPLPTIENDSDIIIAQEQIIGREKTAAEKKAEMERVAKSRPKITQQNKESVIIELEAMISKNKLTLLRRVASSTTPLAPPNTRTTSTAKSTSPPKTNPAAKTATSNQKSNENTPKTKQENPVLPDEPPLKFEENDYKIEGRFSDLLNFLKQMETFAYPAKITQFYLGASETTSPTRPPLQKVNSRQSEMLQLQFRLILYFHE